MENITSGRETRVKKREDTEPTADSQILIINGEETPGKG